jgi:archaeal flagellar protein FlaJ
MSAVNKILGKLPSLTKSKPKTKTKKQQNKLKQSELDKLNGVAYQLIGQRIGRALPIFKDLDTNLQKAGLKINFKAYVSLTIFTTLASGVSILTLLPIMLNLVLKTDILPSAFFGLGIALLISAFCMVGFYFYPVYRADKHKRDLENELPFTTGYMSILANAGVSPERIFSSLAALKQPLAASSEAKDVVRHINLFGMDIISALSKASSRTPSPKLKEVFEGIISSMYSGGNLDGFLQDKFRSFIELRKLMLKKYSDTLSMLAEVYVALLLTAPLLFIIMLSVMSIMGGGSLGGVSSDLLLKLITYVAIPVCAIIFLLIVDSTSPKW